jgi:hypothetical protein
LDALEEIVVFGASGGSLLVGMMLKNLLAVGTLDLFFRGLESVFGKTKDGVMILVLPVFSIAGQHHWVFRLADFTGIVIFDLLDIFLGLDAIIFGEGTLVTSSASMRKKVRTNWLNAALGGC